MKLFWSWFLITAFKNVPKTHTAEYETINNRLHWWYPEEVILNMTFQYNFAVVER